MKKLTAALLACLLLLCCLLTGCGGSSGGYTSGDYANKWEAPGMPADAEINFSPSEDAAYEKPAGSAGTVMPASEKLIYRADLTIETVHFDQAVASLETLAADLGGFIESSNVSGFTNRYADGTTRVVDRSASYVIRVPSDRFKEAVNHAGELGSVTNTSTNVENITSQFIDQEARKHSLEVEEERLLAMVSQAEDVYILVELEDRLAQVRYEIESIERTLRNWQQQVDYSTVSIYLREVEAYTPVASTQRTFGEKLSDALSSGWNSFAEGLKSLVLGLAEGLPIILLILIPGVIVLIVVLACVKGGKKRRARKRAAAAAQPAEPGPVPPVPPMPPMDGWNEPPQN